MNTKNYVIMRDIIVCHHPKFIESADLKKYGLENPEIFDIERLVEEALAAEGGYNFVDETGRDFDDPVNSDSKTTSVVCNSSTKNSFVFIVGSVENKIGSLRVTVFNPYVDRVDFIYLPKKAVQYWKENDGTKGTQHYVKQRIRTSWNAANDHYNKLEDYRVDSFSTLANCMY